MSVSENKALDAILDDMEALPDDTADGLAEEPEPDDDEQTEEDARRESTFERDSYERDLL